MKIVVEKLVGDASVMIYNKQGELIHSEGFYGKTDTSYIRNIPVSEVEYGHSTGLFDGLFEYRVTHE